MNGRVFMGSHATRPSETNPQNTRNNVTKNVHSAQKWNLLFYTRASYIIRKPVRGDCCTKFDSFVVSYFQEQVLAFFINQIVVIRAHNKTVRRLRCTVGMCGGMRASRAPRAFCDACGIYRGYGGDLHARGPFVG